MTVLKRHTVAGSSADAPPATFSVRYTFDDSTYKNHNRVEQKWLRPAWALEIDGAETARWTC